MIKFDPIWSSLIQFDQVWSSLIQFDPIWSNLIQFDPIWSNLIQWYHFYENTAIFLMWLPPLLPIYQGYGSRLDSRDQLLLCTFWGDTFKEFRVILCPEVVVSVRKIQAETRHFPANSILLTSSKLKRSAWSTKLTLLVILLLICSWCKW